jgi:hypothetical protein
MAFRPRATATAAVAGTCFFVFTGSAQAWTVGGYSGRPEAATSSTCFSEVWGAVQQSGCGGTPSWEMQLPVKAGDYFYATVWFNQPNPQTVWCGIVTGSETGQEYFWTGNFSSETALVPVSLNFSGNSTPRVLDGGYMFVGCSMAQGATVYSVNWTDTGKN